MRKTTMQIVVFLFIFGENEYNVAKPKQILTIEKEYNITLKEILAEQNILDYRSRNMYKLNNNGDVVGLNLSFNKIREIKNLEKLKHLSELDLSFNKIVDIKNLEGLKQLSTIHLFENEINEIKNLGELKQLSTLNLSSNQITEIKNLEELKQISELDLSGNQISEIKNLEALKKLSELDLSGNQIAELKNLDGLKHLSQLYLSGNQIAELKNLEELKELSMLNLSSNQITEIKNLEKIKQLSTLNISGNQINEIKNLEELSQLSELYLLENKIVELKNLEELKQLSTLDLSGNQITEIKNLEELNQLSELRLYNNSITELKNLEALKQLSTLDLSDNQITELKNLEELKQLSELDLSGNQIAEIKNLKELKQLSTLYLSGNQIVELKNLEELKQLSTLDLSRNQIIEIKNLKELDQLSELRLFDNSITELKNLEELKQLSTLRLNNNRISELKNLEELKQLLTLDLSGNQITELKNLGSLKQLSTLNLSSNQITEIKNLERLKQLSTLDLSRNQITELKNLEKLKQLLRLYLSGNQITEIKNLEELKQLSTLDFSNNRLDNLYPLLSYLKKDFKIIENYYYLKGIVIRGNPLRKPPMKIVEQGKEKIIEWFQEAEQHGTEPLYEAKLLIVGEPRHGKSSLRKKLIDCDYEIPDEYLEETLGVEIHSNYEVAIPESKENIKVNIWDFGGQEKQYYLHQYFLKKNAVYVLVSDDRKDNTNFEYWMSKLKLFTGNENEISILFNQINRTTHSTNFNSKMYKELGFLFKEYYIDLSKDLERFKNFKNHINEALLQLPHIGEEYPKYCKKISDAIEDKKQKEKIDYITIEGFEKLCEELGYKEPKIIQKALEFLDLIGKIIYYENDHSLTHLIILNPHWLIDAIYGIITSKELEDTNGKFTRNWLDNYLQNPRKGSDKKYSISEIDNILRLMLKDHYDICYTINEKDYLIPFLMPNELPKTDLDFSDGLEIIFKYEIMPKGLIPRLLVRKSEYIYKNLICSNAGILFDGDTYAYITEYFARNDANRYIKIIAKGKNPVDFLQELRRELMKVQKSWFNNIEVIELIPCNCKTCKESESPELYDKNRDLVERTKNGKLKIECRKSYLDIEILPILGAVYNKEIIDFYTHEEIERMRKNSFGINVNFENLIIEHIGDVNKFGKKSHLEKNQFGGKNNKIEEN